MRVIFFLIFFCSLLFSKTVQMNIVADNFKADEKRGESIFFGHVKITKESDIITSKKVIVKFDKENKPISYEAIEDVNFSITLKEELIRGSCQKLTYDPVSKIYTLSKNVDVIELPSNRKLKANYVKIDTILGRISVTGSKNKPIKFIFNVEEKE